MANDYRVINICDEERNELISKLVDELPVLRIKMGLSQEELGGLIGISRQTYSSIETKRRKMSWSLFLSLILIFDHNPQTHDFIQKAGLIPQKIYGSSFKNEETAIPSFLQIDDDIKSHLDEQAIHAIETVIMMEFARCNNMTGDAVIKAFDGKRLAQVTEQDIKARKALENIKSGSAVADKA